jgi:hypothetical protein
VGVRVPPFAQFFYYKKPSLQKTEGFFIYSKIF